MTPDGNAGEGGEAGDGGARPNAGCDTRDTTGAMRVGSAITSNQTWAHVVYIEGSVAVRAGARLAILPGTDVIVAEGGSLVLGSDQSAVELTAAGTEEHPIRFCGEQAGLGAWAGLVIEDGTKTSSELRNVRISDAGSEDAALVLRSAVHIENVSIVGSATDGAWASDFADDSRGLRVENAANAAVVLTDSGAATRFPKDSAFANNGDDAIHLRFSEMNPLTTFHDPGFPYVQETDVNAPEGTLTFEPGVDYRFAMGTGLLLGSTVDKHLLLSATGTAAQPVVFQGVKSGPGSWNSIQVIDNVEPASVLSQVEIRDGATNLQVLYIRSPIRLDHVLLDGNGAGVFVAAQGLDPASTSLTVRNSESTAMDLMPNALVTIPLGGSFTGNKFDEIAVYGGDFTQRGTVPNPGVAFFVTGDIRTLSGSSMTLSAGTEFIMLGNRHFDFAADDGEATVVAVGTADAPIRFTGYQEKAGFWAGVSTGSGLSASSKFSFIDVRYGKAACLTLKMPAAVSNSTFADCSGYGILKNIDDASDYEASNSFANVGSGKVGNLPP